MAIKAAEVTTPVVEIPDEIKQFFEDPQYMGDSRPLPHCQLLNDKTNYGLFVKKETIKRIGWTGPEDYIGHMFNNGTEEEGVLFKTAHLKVLLKSPRFIETRQAREVIGNYETPEGMLLYQQRGDSVSLRTLWLIYICDEAGKLLHAQPLVLSIHGSAAAQFGNAYSAWQAALDRAYGQLMGGSVLAARNEQVYGLFTFSPTFVVEMVGDKQKSPISSTASFIEPTAENFLSLYATEDKELIWAAQDAYRGDATHSGFAKRYMDACARVWGCHAIAPGVDIETGEIHDFNLIAGGQFDSSGAQSFLSA